MSLAHVILGLLQQQERTGYDLKTECFDDCISHLWPADQVQIYRTLDKLESQGWITCTVEIQHGRANRKVCRITKAGETELTQWLQTHHPLPVLRESLLVQPYFSAQLPDEAIVYLLEQELEARQEKLAQCEAIEALSLSNPTASREQKASTGFGLSEATGTNLFRLIGKGDTCYAHAARPQQSVAN